jgi:hypothetical protein
MAELSCPYCAERDAHPIAHAPRWNAMVAAYRKAHGHYPGCPTQVRSAPRNVGAEPVVRGQIRWLGDLPPDGYELDE